MTNLLNLSLSNNKLNTSAASLGYVYNNALNKSEYRASITYQKYYPQISLNWENRARLSYAQRNNGGVINSIPFTWRENYSSLRVALPANGNWLNKSFYSNCTSLRPKNSPFKLSGLSNRPYGPFEEEQKIPLDL